jgi:hypothetical protein
MGPMDTETWAMVEAKRARKAETPKQPSRHLRSRAPYFYPDPHIALANKAIPNGMNPFIHRRRKMMAYFWGIISGIIISVIGSLIGILFIRPVHDLNEALGKLNSILIFRYNVLANPGTTVESISIDTSEELRMNASLLLAKTKRVYWYKCFAFLNLIPRLTDIYESHRLLIGISNNIKCGDKKENRKDCECIAKLLNLKL